MALLRACSFSRCQRAKRSHPLFVHITKAVGTLWLPVPSPKQLPPTPAWLFFFSLNQLTPRRSGVSARPFGVGKPTWCQ